MPTHDKSNRLPRHVTKELAARWADKPFIPTLKSRKEWARQRQVSDAAVNQWFASKKWAAKKAGIWTNTEASYDLSLEPLPSPKASVEPIDNESSLDAEKLASATPSRQTIGILKDAKVENAILDSDLTMLTSDAASAESSFTLFSSSDDPLMTHNSDYEVTSAFGSPSKTRRAHSAAPGRRPATPIDVDLSPLIVWDPSTHEARPGIESRPDVALFSEDDIRTLSLRCVSSMSLAVQEYVLRYFESKYSTTVITTHKSSKAECNAMIRHLPACSAKDDDVFSVSEPTCQGALCLSGSGAFLRPLLERYVLSQYDYGLICGVRVAF